MCVCGPRYNNNQKPLDIASVLVGEATPAEVGHCDQEIAEITTSLQAYLLESVTPLFSHVRSYKTVAAEEFLVRPPSSLASPRLAPRYSRTCAQTVGCWHTILSERTGVVLYMRVHAYMCVWMECP